MPEQSNVLKLEKQTFMQDAEKKKRQQSVLILLAGVLIVGVVGYFVWTDRPLIMDFIRKSGVWGIGISIVLYTFLGATIIPSEPLTVLNGAIFGPFMATIIAGTGNTLAALLEYYLGMKLGDTANFTSKKQNLPLGLGKLPIHSALFLLGGRMIPGYGPKLVSVLGGVYRVPLVRYLWTTAIPTFVGAAIFAYGGAGIFHWR